MIPQTTEVEAPALYLCDMSRQIMTDPMIGKHGYTFEKSAILGWFELGHKFCPCSGKQMSAGDLVAARILKEEIHIWRAENGFPSESIVGMTLSFGKDKDQHTVVDHDLKERDALVDKNQVSSPLLKRLRHAFKVVPRAA